MDSQDLRKAGLKVTVPRMKVLEILDNAEEHHLSAEAIYRHLLASGQDIGLATVYRVLTQFESAGLVKRLHFEGGQAIFERVRGGHHDHIVCVKCGRVDEFVDPVIEQRQRAIADSMGFDIQQHALTIYGQCSQENCPHDEDNANQKPD